MTPVLDDRSWPAYAVPLSSLLALGSLAGGAAAVAIAAASGLNASLLVVAVFLAGLVLTAALVMRAASDRVAGRPTPWWTVPVLGALGVGAFMSPLAGGTVAAAAWSGFVGGAFGGNLVAIRRAHGNRAEVDRETAEREAREQALDREDAESRAMRLPAGDARLDRLLRRRVLAERVALLGWLLAGLIVFGIGAVGDAPPWAIGAVALTSGAAMAWVGRRLWAAWLAHRDYRRAGTPPRRAFVVLLHDPAPRMIRPLLGVWSTRPAIADGAFPKPEAVFRCDEEVTDLLSFQGSVVVHEAWVDTGPRPRSKPHWVVGNDGIAIPHRRGLFGRWYFHALTRSERPDRASPLEGSAPDPTATHVITTPVEAPGLVGALASRVLVLVVVGAMAAVLYD